MILLTGSSGFIGSALLERFVSNNEKVRALVRSHSYAMSNNVSMVKADLSDFSQLNTSWLEDVDVVVYAAGVAHINSKRQSNPNDYLNVNCNAVFELAKIADKSGVKRFVFISSIGVNGNQSIEPFTAEDFPNPSNPYAESKYCAEKHLLSLAKASSMEVVIIRPPLVYGPNAPGNFETLLKWLKKGIPLPFGAVRNKRSFIALENLVDFVMLCSDLERSPAASNQVFVIADNETVSTSELLHKMAEAYGFKSRQLSIPVSLMKSGAQIMGKKSVSESLFGDRQINNSKAQILLGWKPIVTMDEQLKKMALLEISTENQEHKI